MKQQLIFTTFCILAGLNLLSTSLKAQGTVTIDHTTQRFLGDVSTLNRSKYLNAHIWEIKSPNDPELTQFKQVYNIDADYLGSRQFWNPMGVVRDGKIPNVKNKYTGVRDVRMFVATGTAGKLFYDKNVDYSQVDVSQFSKDISAYTAQSFKKDWDVVPMFYEPFNEPMVHAADYYPESFNRDKTDKIITKMCEFHRDMGKAIHAVPELKNIKMMGYGSAWPEFEKDDFSLWNTRYKKFIDIAGEDMDMFSVHLYDGTGLNNTGGRRSGSNAEAIIDMIEAYSFIKLGEVKPIAVTEYGRLVANQPNWKANSGISNYHPVENSQAVRSQIHMVMGFMERGDNIPITIPFSTGKQDPTAQYAKAGLWTKNNSGNWELTPRKYFFEVWKDVKGDRVRINSSNVDVLTQAFVEGNQLYVVLNNLNDNTQTVNLDLLEKGGLQSVNIKRIKTYIDKVPELVKTTQTTAPSNIAVEYGETVVLTYSFNNSIVFDNKIYSTKYYANSYLKPIVANTNNTFEFDNIAVGNGEATLRLGIGRDLGANLKPIVLINGQNVSTEGDLIRGYDQHNRSSFFGILEIPVKMSLLKEGVNSVSVKFPDAGGHIASAILQVQKSDKPLVTGSENITSLEDKTERKSEIVIFPNPADSGYVTLNLNPNERTKISIFNTDGKRIYKKAVKQKELTLTVEGFTKGMYIIKAETSTRTQTLKLTIE